MKRLFAMVLLLLAADWGVAQITSVNFMHDGMIRNFDVHFPPNWAPTDSLPVLLDLHYLGADGRDQDTLTRFNPIADTEHFIVCHPWGFFSDWNVGQQSPYNSGTKDVSFISAVIDTLHARYGADLQRVYAVGMGQGGFMVHRLACELSSRIAACATVGASIHDSTAFYCNTTRPVPMMMVQGTADSVIDYQNGLPGVWRDIPALVDFWKARDNCTGSEITVQLPDPVNEGSHIVSHRWLGDQSSEVLLYEVVNGGFAWPGANRDLGNGGLRNMDINASRHIWDFLQRYTLTSYTPLEVSPATTVETRLVLYPNPVSQTLFLQTEARSLPAVQLLDLQGRIQAVPVDHISARQLQLDLSQLPDGFYLLRTGESVHRVQVVH